MLPYVHVRGLSRSWDFVPVHIFTREHVGCIQRRFLDKVAMKSMKMICATFAYGKRMLTR